MGVIETTGYKKKSYIHFFDEDLQFLYKKEFRLASLSEYWDTPQCREGAVYAIPKGLFGKREETCILKYNVKEDRHEKLDLGLWNMNSFAFSKTHVFGVNTVNFASTIARRSLGNKKEEVFSKSFPGLYIYDLEVLDGNLYALFTEDEKSYFGKVSMETLEFLEKYDVTPYGAPHSMIFAGDKIYLTNQYANFDGKPSTVLTVFYPETKTVYTVDLKTKYPDHLVAVEDLLFVSHNRCVSCKGNQVTVLNLSDETFQTLSVPHLTMQIAWADSFLYILSELEVYKYEYKDDRLTRVA
ncbi:MAG TPA: hypothetical protein PLS28_06185, partial [Clostridiales bacterium]|nr:hypothetical protein [Clostridiales bacterium]